MIGHAFMECIVARTNERGLMLAFLRTFQVELWPSQIDELIVAMSASNGFMRMNIGAFLDLFFRERQMNRLAEGVHFNNCSGRDEYLPPGQPVAVSPDSLHSPCNRRSSKHEFLLILACFSH
jgi:hypothetical protein